MKYKALLCGLIVGAMGAQAGLLTMTDEILVAANADVLPFGDAVSNTAGPANTATFRYTARERDNTGQTNRRIATFLQFDTSSLTAGDVNDAGFLATFSIEHVGHLNDLNNGMDLMFGRVDDGSWDDGGTSNPDFAWGLSSTNQTTLISNVQNYPNATNLTVDVTTIVQDWVLGNTSNQGIALFGIDNGGNASQASYLQNASISTIPEPATLGLIATFGGGLFFLRRRFKS